MNVRELIQALEALDPDAVVYIEDPDTGWLMPVTGCEASRSRNAVASIAVCDYGDAGILRPWS